MKIINYYKSLKECCNPNKNLPQRKPNIDEALSDQPIEKEYPEIDITEGNPNIKDSFIDYLKRQDHDQILFRFILKIGENTDKVIGSFVKSSKEVVFYCNERLVNENLIKSIFDKMGLTIDQIEKITIIDNKTVPLRK